MPADPQDLIALVPFARQLGIVLDEASTDRVIARLAWAPQLCTTAGVLHGGALMTLAVTAGVTGGTVRADAVPLHRGRTTVTAQTSLFDDDGRLVAQATQVQAVPASQ